MVAVFSVPCFFLSLALYHLLSVLTGSLCCRDCLYFIDEETEANRGEVGQPDLKGTGLGWPGNYSLCSGPSEDYPTELVLESYSSTLSRQVSPEVPADEQRLASTLTVTHTSWDHATLALGEQRAEFFAEHDCAGDIVVLG